MAGSRQTGAPPLREIAERRLRLDAAQIEAAARLDALAASLRSVAARGRFAGVVLPRWIARARGAAPRGLYLWGAVGRGKTLLMDLFYESLEFPDRERDHFYVLMRAVHAELRTIRERTRPLDVVADRLAARSRLICLDEFFVADIGDAMILGGLLEGLFRRGVTIVATSNLPPAALYSGGLQRERFLPAIALIERHMQVVHLDGGTDYRLRSLTDAHTYFDSSDPRADARMRALFDALASRKGSGPVELEIDGRTLAARDTAPGLAWFDFHELCETPRGAADYLDLAHRFSTLLVSDVPVFTREREDGARRFLTLIDALYDRGVKLVLAAAAPPGTLYRGEKLSFEFVRAASRLVEMQSREYLATEHRP
ncbi:MAG: AFG1 family ATPase [Gammaproteobacteria bacterium]|nr:AFG1 family ATPase [Gammaproteobacteria bacterium]